MAKRVFKKSRSTSADRSKVRKAVRKASTTLKITKVRYFKTRRGVGYECNTNHKGVKVWNDGQGGETYLTETNPSRHYDYLNEWDLEKLIDLHEYPNK